MPDRGARRTEGPAGPGARRTERPAGPEGACRPKGPAGPEGCMPAQVGPPDRRGACRPKGPAGLSGPPDRGCMPDRGPAGPPRPRGRGACRTEGPFRTGTPHRSGAPAGRGASRNVAPAPASGGLSLCAFRGPLPAGDRDACPATAGLEMGASQESLPADGRGAGAASLATGAGSRSRPPPNRIAGWQASRWAAPWATPLNRRRPAGGGSPRSGTALHVERSSVRGRPSRGRVARPCTSRSKSVTAPAADGPHARPSRGPRWGARGAGLTLPRRWVYSLRGARG